MSDWPTGYYVIQNTPGYLPESPGVHCETFAEALEESYRQLDDLREDGFKDWDAMQLTTHSHIIQVAGPGMYDLGRVIEIVRAK